MKRFSMRVLLIMTLVFASFIINQAKTQESESSISSDEVFWDFGFVPFDYELVHFYDIKNNGDGNLYITHIGSSCDCSHGRALDTLIRPGESTKIKATFSTKNYYGKNTRTLALATNDPKNPVFNLEFVSLIGALPKYVEAQPNALFFLPPHKDKDVKLLNKSKSNINVTISLEPDSIFTVSDTELEIKPDSSATIKVTPNSNLGAGTYHSSFLVEFGTEPNVRVTVPVKIVRY